MERLIIDMDKAILPKYIFQNHQYKIITDSWLCGPAQNPVEIDLVTNERKVLLRGCYPAGFLGRVKASFYHYYPQKRKDILHVCSGAIDKTEGMRLDISPQFNPDYICDAQNMFMVKDETFLWTMSDTPYNENRADTYYDKPMLNKSKVLKEMSRITKSGGFVSVLDESFPVSPPRSLECVARISVTSVPNLTFRCYTVFRKK